MMLSNLNLSSLPECNFEVRYVDSVLLNPCAEYHRGGQAGLELLTL